MPLLLLFQNDQTEGEYVVLIEDDEANDARDHAAPGYELRTSVEVLGSIDLFPADRPLCGTLKTALKILS